jgi:hypothetical protein
VTISGKPFAIHILECFVLLLLIEKDKPTPSGKAFFIYRETCRIERQEKELNFEL